TPTPGSSPMLVKVSPSNLQGWTEESGDCNDQNGTSSGTFVTGPATPPLGVGSFRMSIGTDGAPYFFYRNTAFDGVLTSQLTSLTYSTYVTTDAGGKAIDINLNVDTNNDGVADDTLWFDPAYQGAAYFPTNP